ncbi:protein of unknown function [Streptococcus thermophilus]|uniref:Uncharacterized protein n=1 Tax=Streptococcus thermophilus TaxID=1308 RepID=A0AAU9H6N4_STRTR|nr:hypothetical protein STND_0840 [Streptococcus thermophilus ND03]AFJ83455.1 hypothetical protein Y1U_C1006 [Streptococcus thermophilus MN-ZLW-002]AKH35122.1 Hypothetical protein MNA02_862 [Streptococcus thermophilus]AOZ58091.1 hypothetical protein BBD27_0007 [Streptococcus thermophilus]AOZ60019.1 hypothetical protein BBD27_1935 [Streptococcus thermophilus]
MKKTSNVKLRKKTFQFYGKAFLMTLITHRKTIGHQITSII